MLLLCVIIIASAAAAEELELWLGEYSEGVIHLCRGCKAANYPYDTQKNLWHLRLHLLAFQAPYTKH